MFTNLNSSNDNQKSNPAPQTSSSFMNQKRYQFLGEVKKSKREEILRKRRNMMYKEFTESDKPNTINIDASTDQILEKLYDDLFSSDPQAIFTSLLTFRQISDTGNKDDIYYFEDIQVILNFNKHIDLILNVFSKIVDDLQEEVQLEASKIIVNLSASEQQGNFKQILESKIIDILTYAFKNIKTSVMNEILVAVGNICGESDLIRDQILELGILNELIQYTENQNSHSGIWALCNLFRGSSVLSNYTQKGIPFLLKVASKFSNPEEKQTSEDCLWSLVEFSDSEENSKFFLNNFDDLIPICSILESHESNLVTPFLKFLSNILVHDKNACNVFKFFMKNGLLTQFLKLLGLKNLTIKLEVLTMLSSLVSDNREGVDFVIEIGDLIPKIIYLIKADHKDVQKQGCWVLCKIIKASSPEQLAKLYHLQVFGLLCELLEEADNRILMMSLDCIHDFLEAGSQSLGDDGENFFILALSQVGAIEKIENLQDSPFEMIRKKAIFILENYFEIAD